MARGRLANTPSDFTALGWRDILWRVWAALDRDNVSIIAAGVAFYGMLAIFPAITSFVSIYGLLANPADVHAQFAALKGVIPGEARTLLNQQLQAVASSSEKKLGIGAAVGLIIALWSSGAGIRALMTALNIAYREEEKHSFVRFYGMAMMFTFGIVVIGFFSLGVIVVVPVVLNLIKLGALSAALVKVTPWLVLAVMITIALGALYRYGASRRSPKTRWVSVGAVVATVLWLASSILFSFYVANFASYNHTYGSLGAVVILLMWFWISAYIVLLGAELNAEMEHQTRVDTTEGRPKPMGQRGAFVADHVGEVP
ncbi:MAG: YihY/virulence factor BrkB family protein [Rhizobiales bacterium]|nr:YihY/virulence factor BrkB family protein [Hyphomicrobiales bacterium]